MLDELTPEQFDEWYASWLMEPWGDEWQQAGTIAAAAHNGPLLARASATKLYEPAQFIPRFTTQKQRETEKNLALEQRVMAQRWTPRARGQRSEVRDQGNEGRVPLL